MRICSKALSCSGQSGFFEVMTDASVRIRIYFLTEDIIRIRAGFDGDFREASYALTLTGWDSVTDDLMRKYRTRVTCAMPEFTEEQDAFILKGSRLTVRICKDPYRIRILDRDGTQLHADCADLALREDSNLRRIHTSEIEDGDAFYGFGEKTGSFDKFQSFMVMSPADALGYDPEKTDSLYKHIPFYIRLNRKTHRACGYFYHTSSDCDFDMGRRKSNYWHRHSVFRADGGDIDLFFIAGPEVSSVVRRYTDLTGKSAMLPKAALGYLGSSMYYAELDKDCDAAIERFIRTAKSEDLGIDGFQLSSGYCTAETSEGLKRCVFTWNGERFSDPAAFFRTMDDLGILVTPNVKPGILRVHPDAEEMIRNGVFIRDEKSDAPAVGAWWGGRGYFTDFTSPRARAYWKRKLNDSLFDLGCRSVWNDNCEYDSLVNKDFRCELEGLGGRSGDLRSVMSSVMCHVTVEALLEKFPDSRPFVVCRSGHAGIQRYAQTWSGDNRTCYESLKHNVATMLGMSLSGVANQGSDIGGFFGPAPEQELFVRWVQNGVFQPRFSIHSVNSDNSVTEPWMYSSVKHLIREAINFRYRLSPYLYSMMYRAHVTGLPYFSPMLLEFQHDEAVYDEAETFMSGPSLLVANVLEKGQSRRRVYFPKGECFYDLSTGRRYDGGVTGLEEIFDADLSTSLVFLRGGHILPLAAKSERIRNLQRDRIRSLEIFAAPDRDGEFLLYEDDGVSNDFERGIFLKTRIRMFAGVKTRLVFESEGEFKTSVENLVLNVMCPEKCPYSVSLDGAALEHFLHRDEFERAETGWYYSQSFRRAEVRLPHPGRDFEIGISFAEFDMIGM